MQLGSTVTLVGCDGLVNPATQVGDTGVDDRGTDVAVGGALGHNAQTTRHCSDTPEDRQNHPGDGGEEGRG